MVTQPMEDEAVQKLRVEVCGLLRQELATLYHRLELLGRGRCNQKRGLTRAGAGALDRLGSVGRVVHVCPGVEPGAGDSEERAQQSFVENRHRESPQRRRRSARPRDMIELAR